MKTKYTTTEVVEFLKDKGVVQLKKGEEIVSISVDECNRLIINVYKMRYHLKGVHDCKARKFVFLIDDICETLDVKAHWDNNGGETVLVVTKN